MSHKILTGNNCQACKDLKHILDNLVDSGLDVEWHNMEEQGVPETVRPVRSVPTMIDGNQIVATGLNDILEYIVG